MWQRLDYDDLYCGAKQDGERTEHRFNDVRAREAGFNIFGKPFKADIEVVRKGLQMDPTELQSLICLGKHLKWKLWCIFMELCSKKSTRT